MGGILYNQHHAKMNTDINVLADESHTLLTFEELVYSTNSEQISLNKPEVTTNRYLKLVLIKKGVKRFITQTTFVENIARLSNCLATI